MAKKTFFGGAVVLGAAGLLIKLLGACFRLPLANIIGDTGMAYYQAAYPVYVLLLTLSTAGIPVAISRMVAERTALHHTKEAHRVFKASILLLCMIGLASAAVLFFGAAAIAEYVKMPQAELALKAIAPALLVVPIMAAFRGYFQGMQNMKPTAVSQVIEQVFRVGAGLLLAGLLLTYGVEFAAAGASFGATAGGIGGLTAVLLIYLRQKKQIAQGLAQDVPCQRESYRKILGQILLIAVPITIGSAIMPIMNSIDLAIVTRRLVFAGYTVESAHALYGQLTGMAGPLINFPQVLTQAVAMSLVPTVAAAYKTKDMDFLRHNVQLGYRTAMILGLPCAVGMMTLAEPIMRLLYPSQEASAISAAPCLFILAIGVVFLATVQMLTGVLQGVGKQLIPVRNLCIGAVAKVILTYTLTAVPAINVRGAAIGTVAAYVVASSLNLLAVKKYTGVRYDFKLTIGKPLLSVIIMAAATLGTYHLGLLVLGDSWKASALATVAAVGVAVIVYFTMILVLKAITPEELALLPKGGKLVRILKKFQK
ncbi:MAG: polysaccharide biosynthesis protein [Clostridiales bacterium]|nr:polysaccharide biosynthesis protein [Clostridiales bacterium]